jgi:general secretion pathway protein E
MADGKGGVPVRAGGAGGEPRPPLSLDELLEILRTAALVTSEQAKEIAGRATTLRSRVLKERVGSVHSQAAARYDATPAEIVAAAEPQNAKSPRRKLDEDAVAEAVAAAAGVPYLKIDPLRIDGDLVAKTLSRPFARRHAVIPVGQGERGQLRIALTDPFDSALRESLESLVQRPVEYVVSARRDLLQIIDRVYGFRSSVRGASEHLGEGGRGAGLVELVQLRSGEELANATANDQHVIHAVEHLLNYAFEQRASDIHLEPRDSAGLVRFRIDGILHDIEKVPLSVHGAITSRVKVLARMDIAERRRPQDGRIKTMRGDREVELRVSSIATAFGEKIVVRVLDPSVLMTDLHQLGFGLRDREIYERWITAPSGLILVSGPTGSGKTTTLYSTLRYLAGPEVNIQTVEDPIEVVDPRFAQMPRPPGVHPHGARAKIRPATLVAEVAQVAERRVDVMVGHRLLEPALVRAEQPAPIAPAHPAEGGLRRHARALEQAAPGKPGPPVRAFT